MMNPKEKKPRQGEEVPNQVVNKSFQLSRVVLAIELGTGSVYACEWRV